MEKKQDQFLKQIVLKSYSRDEVRSFRLSIPNNEVSLQFQFNLSNKDKAIDQITDYLFLLEKTKEELHNLLKELKD